MSFNIEPKEYHPNNTETVKKVQTNPWSFSISWTGKPNMNGVKPPNPQFQEAPDIPYILPQTILPGPSQYGNAPVGIIQSRREPYAVEWYKNPYGGLESRLGTNLGA